MPRAVDVWGREVSDPDGGGTAVLLSNTRAYLQSPFKGTQYSITVNLILISDI